MKHNNMRDEEIEMKYKYGIGLTALEFAERERKAKLVQDMKLTRSPVTMDTDYKLRYEQAMNILETIFNPYAWDGSMTGQELLSRIEVMRSRYDALRDNTK